MKNVIFAWINLNPENKWIRVKKRTTGNSVTAPIPAVTRASVANVLNTTGNGKNYPRATSRIVWRKGMTVLLKTS
ncbi:MAG: hypothetical protein JSV24_02345 [Bacteroidales bacterium]|nr:MAG: hypothetical protein JSV24_02345 [Bacteroidales bacterium]